MQEKNKLQEVAALFFKLGCFAFGGPAAHIAMTEHEVVEKRGWMSKQEFLDLIGATNLIPGPNSTEMTMHCGHKRAGKAGLFVAGICFIFPAVFITGFLAWLYVEFGSTPEVKPYLQGIIPAVLAVIASAVLKLGKKALKSKSLIVLGSLVLSGAMLGFPEVYLLLGAGLIGAMYFFSSRQKSSNVVFPILLFKTPILASKATSLSIFLTFLKVGSILYGSGYVLFAYLEGELVNTGLLSYSDLMEAIAVGQFTPGPVLSTATFIGYQLNGLSGAFAATAGIFLPSFLFVLILNPLIPKMRKSKFLRGFLDSVNVAAVAVMAALLIQMGMESLVNWKALLIAILSVAYTFGVKKSNPIFTILGGGLLGALLHVLF